MKYIPGFKFQYQQRYLLATKNELSYFKTEVMSLTNLFPLQKIDLEVIDRVQRVTFDAKTRANEEQIFNFYQFEIFLKTNLLAEKKAQKTLNFRD